MLRKNYLNTRAALPTACIRLFPCLRASRYRIGSQNRLVLICCISNSLKKDADIGIGRSRVFVAHVDLVGEWVGHVITHPVRRYEIFPALRIACSLRSTTLHGSVYWLLCFRDMPSTALHTKENTPIPDWMLCNIAASSSSYLLMTAPPARQQRSRSAPGISTQEPGLRCG